MSRLISLYIKKTSISGDICTSEKFSLSKIQLKLDKVKAINKTFKVWERVLQVPCCKHIEANIPP